jgi:hypothetical protein
MKRKKALHCLRERDVRTEFFLRHTVQFFEGEFSDQCILDGVMRSMHYRLTSDYKMFGAYPFFAVVLIVVFIVVYMFLTYSNWLEKNGVQTLPSTIPQISKYIEFLTSPPYSMKSGNMTGGMFFQHHVQLHILTFFVLVGYQAPRLELRLAIMQNIFAISRGLIAYIRAKNYDAVLVELQVTCYPPPLPNY